MTAARRRLRRERTALLDAIHGCPRFGAQPYDPREAGWGLGRPGRHPQRAHRVWAVLDRPLLAGAAGDRRQLRWERGRGPTYPQRFLRGVWRRAARLRPRLRPVGTEAAAPR